MDIPALIAAVPVVRRAWKHTPTALRVPLVAVGVAWIAWQWYSERESGESVASNGPSGPGSTSH